MKENTEITESLPSIASPFFTIRTVEGSTLGNCYYSTIYEIRSVKKLSKQDILTFRKIGLLGFGQYFMIQSACDGSESCCETYKYWPYDRYTEQRERYYTGEPYIIEQKFYVYRCESRVDSSG